MNKTVLLAAAAGLASALSIATPALAQPGAGYRVQAEYKLEGAGPVGGIWIDAVSRRLYVAHGEQVEVLNADTGNREGAMPAQDAAGILVAEAGHGFFANRSGNSVALFDPASFTVTNTVPLDAKGPESLVYDSEAGKVFVVAPGSGQVVALDARTGAITGSVSLEGHLRGAVTNNMGSLFIAVEDRNAIDVVDTHTLKFLGSFPSGDAQGPVSLAIDPSGRRLFVACANGKLAVIDTDIGFTFEELQVGDGDSGSFFTFAPQGKGGWKGADFVASSDGALTLVQMNAFIRYSVGGTVSIPKGIQNVAWDSKTHWLYLPGSTPGPRVLVMTAGPAAVESAEAAQ